MPLKKCNIFNNILIVRTDRIGDVVVTTPAIKALRLAYPRSRISILISPKTYDVVNGNPYIDDILVDDRQGKHKYVFGFLRLLMSLRRKKFDLAVIFHTKRRYNVLCFLAGIRHRLGYKNNKWGFLLTDPLIDTRAKGQKHEAQYCLDVLKAIDVAPLIGFDIFVPSQKQAESWVLPWMRKNGIRPNEMIVIHPGSSDQAKCWPRADFARLIDQLTLRYTFKIVLIGSPQTIPTCEEILRLTNRPSECLNVAGETTLAQTASLLRRAFVLISNDSGPVHIASGVGIWVISLFLRNDPGVNAARWRPLGPKSFVLPQDASQANKPGAILTDHVLELMERIITRDNQYQIS